MNYNELADLSLSGGALDDAQCRAVLEAPDADVLSLLAAAYRVRRHHWGNKVQIHLLSNAKSGLCPEDCHYCSQSSISSAEIDRYALRSPERLLAEARKAAEARSRRFCIVISARGPEDREVDQICDAVKRIKGELGLDICCSVGLLNPDQAAKFKAAGVNRINHNLNTSEKHYAKICTTHEYRDRVETLKVCREAGLELCSGAIFGQGEADDDIIAVSREFRAIGMESIPINFLIPIAGTPFASIDTGLTPMRCLKILSLVRFLNPSREIRIAGGREVHLRSLQPLGLYPANSIFVAGYLTEPGQGARDAWKMIEDLGFEIEVTAGADACEADGAAAMADAQA